VALSVLKTRDDFVRVRGGRRWTTPALALEARARPAGGTVQQGPRFGFTVTKKIGNAVVRNRVRRRLRALVAGLDPALARDSFDYVLIARAAAVDRPYLELKADLEQALRGVHRPSAQGPRGQKHA
jgi:ribonuclease P protein component